MRIACFLLFFILASCAGSQDQSPLPESEEKADTPDAPFLVVLGTAQDAGSPQIACEKACCTSLFQNGDRSRHVSSLGLVSPVDERCWLFDATPDFTAQTAMLTSHLTSKKVPDGIFLTHAHIGHYTGLMFLGREALGANAVSVYAMPRMQDFLQQNGPWSQLVKLNNIKLQPLANEVGISLNDELSVTPIIVPHRDEFSETVGFFISGPQRTGLFIPDIDKWDKWDRNIDSLIQLVDYAFLDATFYNQQEMPNRDMAEIPHPFVVETMETLKQLSKSDRQKVFFIHMNHSNPMLNDESAASKAVQAAGFNIARKGMRFEL